ncbi:MAG: sigma-54-dependent transcriptional regulator [Planctomycetota bacterium]|jgi:DNA-binding NtrC family response regulator
MGFNILVVDDESTMRKSLARLLRGSGYSVQVAGCAEGALRAAREKRPDLVLLDICLPDSSGLEVLAQLKQMDQRVIVIAMTAFESTRDAILAMKGGAYDYLSKPFNIDTIRLLVKQALEDEQFRNVRARSPTEPWQGSACDRIIGSSQAMRRVLDIIHRLPRDSRSNLLIEGETGTGKELLAHAIHEINGRVTEPFIAICCGAVPRDLLESELFGYDKGAYTGARPEGKKGAFEQAGGGTIFLDEIGELDLNLQVKLLRVVEVREFCRVGSLKRIPLRARLIAATNRRLKEDVEEGRFRADLYYRLNVVRITLPPLRERPSDVMPLAETFLKEFNALFDKNFTAFSPSAQKLLEDHPWPGNVRELRNTIERIALLETGDTILPGHLSPEVTDSGRPARCRPRVDDAPSDKLFDIEKERIAQALTRTGGNVAKAARLLGLKRGALRYRMDKYGIARAGLPAESKRGAVG